MQGSLRTAALACILGGSLLDGMQRVVGLPDTQQIAMNKVFTGLKFGASPPSGGACGWGPWVGCDEGGNSVLSISAPKYGLNGTIPEEIGDLEDLRTLDLTANAIWGTLPEGMGRLYHLQRLEIGLNKIEGTLPAGLVILPEMEQMLFFCNQISGTFPSNAGSMRKLRRLFINHNDMQGFLPTELGLLTDMRQMDISLNSWDGQLPDQLSRLTKMWEFRVADTLLRGNLPHLPALSSCSTKGSFMMNLSSIPAICSANATPTATRSFSFSENDPEMTSTFDMDNSPHGDNAEDPDSPLANPMVIGAAAVLIGLIFAGFVYWIVMRAWNRRNFDDLSLSKLTQVVE